MKHLYLPMFETILTQDRSYKKLAFNLANLLSANPDTKSLPISLMWHHWLYNIFSYQERNSRFSIPNSREIKNRKLVIRRNDNLKHEDTVTLIFHLLVPFTNQK